MKKLKAIMLAGAVVLTMSACSSNQSQPNAESVAQAESQSGSSGQTVQEIPVTVDSAQMGENNILITYFTVPETDGVDTVARASRVVVGSEVLGNCQYVAQLIQATVGGELFEIETVQEYPGSHDPLLDFAYAEKAGNARPELASRIEKLEDYDYIFIGFPNWNADLPMPLYTFLEENDFGGKTIIPFTTHGGSGFSRTVQTIAEMQTDATVMTNGLSISRDSVQGAQNQVVSWAESLGL